MTGGTQGASKPDGLGSQAALTPDQIIALEQASNFQEQLVAINQDGINQIANAREQDAQKAIVTEENIKDAKIALANQTFNILGELAKEGSKLSKGVAAAQATQNTYQGITAALSATSVIPDPLGTALKIANAAVIGVTGFKNVSNILKTKPIVTSAPTADATGGGGVSAPSFNLVQGTDSNQIAESLRQDNAPVKAFVVSTDMSTSQSLDRNIVSNSSIG